MKKHNRNSECVLVVDDEVRLLTALSSILQENGYRVLTAETGQESREIFNMARIDVVILDLKLPDTDGITLLKEILEVKPLLPVIMLTAHGSVSKAVEATKYGAYDFFEKPVASKKILITIENALKSSRLERERSFLLKDALERYQMVGVSSKMKHLFQMIETVAETDSRVLIRGESGTGKELVARAIHLRGNRAGSPLVTVNCSAIPEDLLESELFGHEKGAFTGAFRKQKGKFEQASLGTLFLDEIGEMGLRTQPKVLRAIENGEIQRLGGDSFVKIDVRIIAATNRDLKAAVQNKEFREDLFYRLNVININIPPLRERKEDISLLVEYFLNNLCQNRKRKPVRLNPAALEKLIEYHWPGNVRELRNLMEKIAILTTSESISGEELEFFLQESGVSQLPPDLPERPEGGTLAQILKNREKEAVQAALKSSDWDYQKAALELGISRSTLFSKIKTHQIERNRL